MTNEQLSQELARLKAENDALRAAQAEANKPRALTLKVSQKGALSLYGMGRFPITLYQEQWARVLGHKAQIEAFIVANKATLKLKGDATEAAKA